MIRRLYHFSDEPGIARFEPRPVAVPSPRPPGQEWLNGPLVWAIDEWHQPLYFFPRDCPRILLWPLPTTTDEDLRRWWGDRDVRMVAYVEREWLPRIAQAMVYRYTLPADSFEPLHDAGMWVSRDPATPVGAEAIAGLPHVLQMAGVELVALDDLTPLRGVWRTTLHASGIRLRNAKGWT
ncbi:MAG: hypothetical protein Kow0010_08050 [Dehalococcoidia bacterium]